jgi:hypothetical protein
VSRAAVWAQRPIAIAARVCCAGAAQARASRNLEAPTPEMYAECQELLQLFGLPFIVAPMEVGVGMTWEGGGKEGSV